VFSAARMSVNDTVDSEFGIADLGRVLE